MQCMSPDCHHTEFLTAVYKFLDAEALLVHINAHANQQSYLLTNLIIK
jgi:hypothetical protein